MPFKIVFEQAGEYGIRARNRLASLENTGCRGQFIMQKTARPIVSSPYSEFSFYRLVFELFDIKALSQIMQKFIACKVVPCGRGTIIGADMKIRRWFMKRLASPLLPSSPHSPGDANAPIAERSVGNGHCKRHPPMTIDILPPPTQDEQSSRF